MSSLAGRFLVAKPTLQDPNFRQSVVLVLQHSADGAFGLIVNRPARVKGEAPFPIFSGGPCESPGLLMLHGHAEWLTEAADAEERAVAPEVYMGDAQVVERVSDPQPGQTLRYRIFVGYSGWGPGQLDRELARGDWAVAPASGDVLFETPPEELWELLLPPSLPQPSLN